VKAALDPRRRIPEARHVTSPQDEQAMQRKLERLFREAQRWTALWGLSRLMRDVDIEFSGDLGAALGHCDLTRLTITLNAVLMLERNEALLLETLCHELAHVVASVRYGTRIEEHGPEWAEYMTRAGFIPRPVIPESRVAGR